MSYKNQPQFVEAPARSEQSQNELNEILQRDSTAKNTPLIFSVRGTQIKFPDSRLALGQQKAREKALNEWASNPISPKNGIDGHAFSVLVSEVLGMEYSTRNEGLVAIPAPATVQFIDNNLSKEWGPSGDIIIGEANTEGVIPRLLISTHMGDKDKRNSPGVYNNKLQVPVYHLYGNSFFNSGSQVTFSFGSAISPRRYIESMAQEHGAYLRQAIGVAMS